MLAIPEANPVFEAPVRFSIDGLTEKLHLFKCNKEEELKNVVKRHIYYVGPHLYDLVLQKYFQFLQEKGGGLASLLYSIVLSKGWEE